MNIDLLRQLCETPGVPGREHRVRKLIETEIEGLFAVFFGLILLPDLKAETIRAVVARALPMR